MLLGLLLISMSTFAPLLCWKQRVNWKYHEVSFISSDCSRCRIAFRDPILASSFWHCHQGHAILWFLPVLWRMDTLGYSRELWQGLGSIMSVDHRLWSWKAACPAPRLQTRDMARANQDFQSLAPWLPAHLYFEI